MSIIPPEIPVLNSDLLPPVLQEPNEVVPFETLHFNYPGSDIVLRSRDSYDFPLLKIMIIICSPVLRNLIESVSNTSGVPNGEEPLPVVNVPESKETLYYGKQEWAGAFFKSQISLSNFQIPLQLAEIQSQYSGFRNQLFRLI